MLPNKPFSGHGRVQEAYERYCSFSFPTGLFYTSFVKPSITYPSNQAVHGKVRIM